MTSLTLAVRNFLALQPSVTSFLGDDDIWDTWIFEDSPEVNIEGTGKAMIVVSVNGSWTSANSHNTAKFPQVIVDIWVDPERNPDGSVFQKDAKDRAERIYEAVDKLLHQMHNSVNGESIFWGTAEQITSKTGSRIFSSLRVRDPDYRPAFDDQGAWMATVRYNVETA